MTTRAPAVLKTITSKTYWSRAIRRQPRISAQPWPIYGKLINVSNHSSLVLVPFTFEKLRRICSPQLPLFVNFQVLEFGTIWSLFSFDSCCLTTVSNLSSLVGFNLASLQFLIFHHFSTELWDVNKENFSKTLHAFGDNKFTQFSGKVPCRL